MGGVTSAAAHLSELDVSIRLRQTAGLTFRAFFCGFWENFSFRGPVVGSRGVARIYSPLRFRGQALLVSCPANKLTYLFDLSED